MTVECLAVENQEVLEIQPAAHCAPEQACEITPLAFETFSLIGGGSSAVLL